MHPALVLHTLCTLAAHHTAVLPNHHRCLTARKLKLPNAYTAAITDYMRKPVLEQLNTYNQSTTYCVSKKDFELKAVEVILNDTSGVVTETRVITKDRYGDWCFRLKDEERWAGSRVSVIDAAGRETVFRIE